MKHFDNKKLRFKTLLGNRTLLLSVGLSLCANFVLKAQSNASYYLNNAAIKGTYNSAFGYQSLYKNTGSYNTATGYNALYSNTTGSYNTANGMYALYSNTTGQSNTAIGTNALYKNTSGFENTAVGNSALLSNTIGAGNTAIGKSALTSNTTGEGNTATGYQALQTNNTGLYNTATGGYALYSNIDGYENTASGYGSMEKNSTGHTNTAYGFYSLGFNISGYENTAIGHNALSSNTTASGNTAVGTSALSANTTGNANTATGYLSLGKNTIGTRNMANGNFSLQENTSGSRNSAAGFCALQYNTTGSYNAAAGTYALLKNTGGSQNTAFGYNALQLNTTGSYNTTLGATADVTLNNLSNATAIGYQAKVGVSNTIVIGNTSITKISGKVSWSTLSDARFKKDVKPNVHGLDFILQLKPVTYHMDVKKLNTFLGIGERNTEAEKEGASQEDATLKQIEEQAIREKEAILYTGFLAQDVEQAAKAVNYDFSGVQKPAHDKDHYSLSYGDFVVPLVKAVQEQQQMIEAQKLVNEQLKQEMEELKKTIAILTGATSSGITSEMDAASESVKVYPNPSKGVFTIAVERPGRGTLEVYDLSGNKVQSLTLQSNISEYKIDLSGKQKGVYSIQIVSEGRKVVRKIVLE